MSNDLDELFNEEDEDDGEEDEEDEDGDVSSALDSRRTVVDEDNHWLMRGVKRIRRSIDDFFGSPIHKAEDEAERHMKKPNGQGRKGKGKGKGSEKRAKTKAERAVRKQQREEKRKAKEEKQKVRQEKQKAREAKRMAKEHKPASRVRRQHMLGSDADDEDFIDGSGSGPGPFQALNKLCEFL